jgi:hypothetical protein
LSAEEERVMKKYEDEKRVKVNGSTIGGWDGND